MRHRIQLNSSPGAATHFEKIFLPILLKSAIMDESRKYFFIPPLKPKTMRIIHQTMQNLTAHLMI